MKINKIFLLNIFRMMYHKNLIMQKNQPIQNLFEEKIQ